MDEKNVQDALRQFVVERDWGQFHSAENLAKSISIESAELLEEFQWGEPKSLDNVRMELADVLTYCFMLADKLEEDPEQLILEKLELTKSKYPAGKFKGSSRKHSE